MTVYEDWFWHETYRFFHDQAVENLKKAGLEVPRLFPMPDLDGDKLWDRKLVNDQLRQLYNAAGTATQLPPLPILDLKESALTGSSLDMRHRDCHGPGDVRAILHLRLSDAVAYMRRAQRTACCSRKRCRRPARVKFSRRSSFSIRRSASCWRHCLAASTTRTSFCGLISGYR